MKKPLFRQPWQVFVRPIYSESISIVAHLLAEDLQSGELQGWDGGSYWKLVKKKKKGVTVVMRGLICFAAAPKPHTLPSTNGTLIAMSERPLSAQKNIC